MKDEEFTWLIKLQSQSSLTKFIYSFTSIFAYIKVKMYRTGGLKL